MDETNEEINYFILFFRIISIIIIIVCLYVLYLWYQDNNKNGDIKDTLAEKYVTVIPKNKTTNDENKNSSSDSKESDSNDINNSDNNGENDNSEDSTSADVLEVNFDALLEQNSDTVAWIRIPSTNISYPVVQAEDNDFYLTRNFENQKNGAGWIFADYRNNFERLDKNTIIYGHNRRNGSMFSNLQFYLDKKFYSDLDHKYINFNTKNQSYIAEIFSVYRIHSDYVELNNNFNTITELEETIEAWKNASVFDFQTEVHLEDNILTLYTCDNNNAYRIIIHAKLIPVG